MDNTSNITINNNYVGIDRNSPLPLYYQLKQIILQQIQKGIFYPQQILPTEKELQEYYQVSRITVRRALTDLVNEGFITRQSGKGTFILTPKFIHSLDRIGGIFEDLIEQGYKYESKIIEHGVVPAPGYAAHKLNVKEGQPVFFLYRLVCTGSEPLFLSKGFHRLTGDVTFSQEELENNSIYWLLRQKYGIRVIKVNRTIEATLAVESEAALLHVQPNSLMLLGEMVTYDILNQEVSFVKQLFRGDRHKFRLTTFESSPSTTSGQIG